MIKNFLSPFYAMCDLIANTIKYCFKTFAMPALVIYVFYRFYEYYFYGKSLLTL
jgi:hypothetical protein